MSARIETKELKEIKCPNMGTVNVFVQGQRSGKETVILNVHDLGYNHSHYIEFLNDMSMKKIAQKSVWVFVVLPGHLGESSDLPDDYVFPSLQAIADDLVTVLEELKIKEVVLFGDGAGANILLRFALSNPSRVLGAFLINVIAASNTLLESVQDKFRSWQIIDNDKASADDLLVFHRFGAKPNAIMKYHHSNATRMAVERYQEFVHRHLNIHNIKLYIEAYNKRTAIPDIAKLRCSAVFVTSERSSFRKSTRAIHQTLLKVNCNKSKVEFVDVSNAGHVMEESPEKVIESLQYFLQGLGVVSSVPMQNLNVVKQPRVRSMSMQDYDIPVKVRQRQRNISVAEYTGVTGVTGQPVAVESRARRSAAGYLVTPGEVGSSPQTPQRGGGDEEPLITPHKVMGINSINHSDMIAEEEEKPVKKGLNGTAEI